jgi:aconitase A
MAATLLIKRTAKVSAVQVRVPIDTPIEAEYYRHGGILLDVLRQLTD